MPNPLDIPIQVTLKSPTKLQVEPSRARVPKDEEPTLRWTPASHNIEIQFIGFNDPVGPSSDIGQPEPDGDKPTDWIASDRNTVQRTFTYTVYALNSQTGNVISSDPEIENEGKSGEEEEERGPGSGAGRGRGPGPNRG